MPVHFSEIERVLKAFGISATFHDYFYSVDNNNRREIVNVIATYRDIVRRYVGSKYLYEYFDCDDFAWVFKAVCSLHKVACGFCKGTHMAGTRSGGHAFNVYPWRLGDGMILLLVEPEILPVSWMGFTVMEGNPVAFGSRRYYVRHCIF